MKHEKSTHYYQMFGKNMARILKEKNLSQVAVAKMLGISQIQVSRWSRGIHAPSMGTLFKLCDIYKIEPIEFYKTENSYQQRNLFDNPYPQNAEDELFKEYVEFANFKKMKQQLRAG